MKPVQLKNPMRAANVQKTVDLLNETKPIKFIVPAISPIHVVLSKYIINEVPAYNIFYFKN